MKAAHKSDVGRIRLVNEDRVVVQTGLNGLTLAILADGMGGHQAGDIASQMAIEIIQEQLQTLHAGMSVKEWEARMRDAILLANSRIYHEACREQKYHGMGTTVVVAVASRERILISHIGDSRAYKISANGVDQLTEDHSLVNELVKRGQLSREEADQHPRRNVLTQALGTEENVAIDTCDVAWSENEMLMLCSDGLTDLIQPQRMNEILRASAELQWKVDKLVESALEAGGDDNITVVLISNEKAEDGE